MKTFPDESHMERSKDGTDPIRGGSIGLNRILGRFVNRSKSDHRPEFTAVILSAFTIVRNVVGTEKDITIVQLEEAFVRDVNLFLDYYDTYLSITKSGMMRDKLCPVVIYFPDYKRVENQIRREQTGQKAHLLTLYAKFLSRYNGRDEMVRELEHCRCYWIRAGDATYPHKEVARKFREIASQPKSAYSSGDKIALMSHVPLDYHLVGRLRGINLLESYTGELKGSDQFGLKLDKEGRLPFNTVTHVVFGDASFIKPWVSPKVRKQLLEQAVKEKWVTRSEDDLRAKISKAADIPLVQLRKFDFI